MPVRLPPERPAFGGIAMLRFTALHMLGIDVMGMGDLLMLSMDGLVSTKGERLSVGD